MLLSERKNKRLNTPFGARCFLTARAGYWVFLSVDRLNAPFGARCFLIRQADELHETFYMGVLMHLLALGAF